MADIGRLGRDRVWELTGLWLRTLAGSLGAGFLVTGTGLVGLAIAIFTEVLGYTQIGLSDDVGEALGGGVVLGSVGWLLVGIAWEALLRQAPRHGPWSSGQRTLAWLVGLAGVSGVLAVMGSLGRDHAGAVWPSLSVGGLLLLAVGLAGLLVAPVAVGISWALERAWPRFTDRVWRPMLLAAWGAVALALFLRSFP